MRLYSLVIAFALPLTSLADDLSAVLKRIADEPILPKEFDAPNMLSRDVRARLREANDRDYEAWQKIKTKEDWEKFRDVRITALKKSLGHWPEVPKETKSVVTKTIKGDGYTIENTLFHSRPGMSVTANVYCPATPRASMPGILIVHSHHNPKHEGELQDMGVTWARAGCYVMVMDQFGHGERRVHPFNKAEDYKEPFRVGRQDYYFRYNVGNELALIGDSLMGWMAWDLMRGIDVLLQKPGIDKEKIIMLGAVAGGGDPAAVTAALDPRITCVVPFNFGGPQPETRPLGEDADRAFNYVGSGSWESTRNLRDSARDGFLPWVICASVAPRRLIHAHEFAWDREHDPVWKRYQKIWGFYNATDKLAFTHGVGTLTSKDPPGSHCNNIGPLHRKNIHAAFEKWFGIKAEEFKERHTAEELVCWNKDDAGKLMAGDKPPLNPGDLNKLVWDANLTRATLGLPESKSKYFPDRNNVEAISVEWSMPEMQADGVTIERGVVTTVRNIRVPCLLVRPGSAKAPTKYPLVIGIAHDGKGRMANEHAEAIANLVNSGVAVCLPDLRGMGETRLGNARGRSSSATAINASEMMLGSSTMSGQLEDLLAIIKVTSKRPDVDGTRIGLWGESFAPMNHFQLIAVPHDAPTPALIGEPAAGLLVQIAVSIDGKTQAILTRRTIETLHPEEHRYLPGDFVVPGMGTLNALKKLYRSLPPSHRRVEESIDQWNRPTVDSENQGLKFRHKNLQPWPTDERPSVEISLKRSTDAEVAKWFQAKLKK